MYDITLVSGVQHNDLMYVYITKKITTVSLTNVHQHTVTIFSSDLLSQQLSNIQYSSINYSHHAIYIPVLIYFAAGS